MNRSETRTCHSCGGSITSPKLYPTSEAINWLVAQGWHMDVSKEHGVRYFCVVCGVPVPDKLDNAPNKLDNAPNKLEDIF